MQVDPHASSYTTTDYRVTKYYHVYNTVYIHRYDTTDYILAKYYHPLLYPTIQPLEAFIYLCTFTVTTTDSYCNDTFASSCTSSVSSGPSVLALISL